MGKILILTAGYGEGHNSAARALQVAVREEPGATAEVVDLFALQAPRFNALSRHGYLGLIRRAPRVWSSVYRWLDRSPRAPEMFRLLASHRSLLARLIAEKQPTAIVSTYPVYGWLLNDLRRNGRVPCPCYTVITDALTINSLWYATPSDGWFVTDEDSASFLRARGVPPTCVHVSGFPVAPAFADRPAHLAPPEICHVIRDKYPEAAPRVLFMINTGRESALRISRELLRHREWRLTITAGRDAKLRREVEALAQQASAAVDVLGWTDRVPELLMTHHVVISKAGGATTQEAINALCPMIVNQIVPGQEEGNYELLRRHDAGTLAPTPEEIARTLQAAFANDGARWRQWRDNLRRIARPHAARDIARHVLSATAATLTR
jgi:processive 1,2-diacylglycerol beta-glucosyltransferase